MRRLGLAAGMAAVLLMGLVPVTAGAAPVMRFGEEYYPLALRSNCINGIGPADSVVHVVWKSAGGLIKAFTDVASSPDGGWVYCSASRRLAAGDTIRARSGAYGRTFTMPNISLSANRVRETFRGMGLPGRTGELSFRAGNFADYDEQVPVTADSNGRWKHADGAWGGNWAGVTWTTARGDFLAATIAVPYLEITIGRAAVYGGWRSFDDVTVKLRDPSTNALRARATATLEDFIYFTSAFRDAEGDLVDVRVGDRVVSNITADLDWHVPQITGSADVAADFVYGECGATEIESFWATVHVYRRGVERGYADVDLDENHQLAVDFMDWEDPGMFYDPANIKHGDRIVIDCHYRTGDIIKFPFRVP